MLFPPHAGRGRSCSAPRGCRCPRRTCSPGSCPGSEAHPQCRGQDAERHLSILEGGAPGGDHFREHLIIEGAAVRHQRVVESLVPDGALDGENRRAARSCSRNSCRDGSCPGPGLDWARRARTWSAGMGLPSLVRRAFQFSKSCTRLAKLCCGSNARTFSSHSVSVARTSGVSMPFSTSMGVQVSRQVPPRETSTRAMGTPVAIWMRRPNT